MNLFISFFDENYLEKGEVRFFGKYFEQVVDIFPVIKDLSAENIENAIGLLKGINNSEKKSYSLNIKNIETEENSLKIQFVVNNELEITNGIINKSLYTFAKKNNWIKNDNKYYPVICVVEKEDFDKIRKGTINIRKISSHSAKIDELKQKNDWNGICNIYEPLEKIHNDNEVWNNTYDLYNIGFACSKLGEPKNGLERDKKHLENVARYREISIQLYKRCCELEPMDFRYPSSLAYRHYLNLMELTKPKGRKDGNASKEISEALKWLDEAIKLKPNSIKDNYRKGKLLLDKQIPIFNYSKREWKKDTFDQRSNIEEQAFESLGIVIEEYEKNVSEKNKYYFKEYVKSLYSLGSYFIDKQKSPWFEYACSKLTKSNYKLDFNNDEMKEIVKAREYLEKCYNVESENEISTEVNHNNIVNVSRDWAVSSMDKLYRLGLVYLYMFFIKKIKNDDKEAVKLYGKKAYTYLNTAKLIGEENRRSRISRRDSSFINVKISWYFILNEEYEKAIKEIEKLKASYIKNTYSIALMLSENTSKFFKAQEALKEASKDKYNMAGDLSKTLLAYSYKLNGQEKEYNKYLQNIRDDINSSGKKLISLLEAGDLYEDR